MLSASFIYLGIAVPATILAPASAAVIRYRHLPATMRRVFFYLLLAAAGNAVATTLSLLDRNNLALLHVYTAVELFMLARFFQLALDNPSERRAAKITGLLFPLLCILNIGFLQNMKTFNTYTRPVESILLGIFSILYLSSNTRSDDHPDVFTRRPETWVVIGILVYFSSALFQFAFSNIISRQASHYTRMLIWDLHASLVMIMYVLFTVGFIKCRR
jgi:hypothetical protein